MGTSDVDLQKTRKILITLREALQSKFKPTKKNASASADTRAEYAKEKKE